MVIGSPQAHLTHVSTLSGPGRAPVSGRLSAAPAEGLAMCSGFPLPFGHRRWLLGSSCSRWGVGPSLRSADRTYRVRTPTGFPRSTRVRYDRGGCPLNSGTAVLSRLTMGVQPAPAASQRPVLHPAAASHLRSPTITKHHQGFTRVHPSGLPLAGNSRMERESLGVSSGLHTPPLPAAHARVGTGPEHWPGTNLSTTTAALLQVIHSNSCDFVSHPSVRGRGASSGQGGLRDGR